MPRARILGRDIRKRIAEARRLLKAIDDGKSILDFPVAMIRLPELCRQLADDAAMLLDAREAEREG